MGNGKKVVLITGCSSGFGREMVSMFLREGWAVIATMRRAEDRKQVFARERPDSSDDLAVLNLDVTSPAERSQVYHAVQGRWDKLDCLVNNAGYGLFGALEDLSEQQFRHQFETNFWGAVFMTRQFLPLLRKSGGRIINVSSVAGFSALPLASAYVASKFALEGLSESLYYELKSHGVQVALVEPGRFPTRFSDNVLWGEADVGSGAPYSDQTGHYMRFRTKLASENGTSPKAVAATILRLARARNMPLRTRCGKDATAFYMFKKLTPENLLARLLSVLYHRVLLKP